MIIIFCVIIQYSSDIQNRNKSNSRATFPWVFVNFQCHLSTVFFFVNYVYKNMWPSFEIMFDKIGFVTLEISLVLMKMSFIAFVLSME